MKYFGFILALFLLSSCNAIKWNQKRLTNKYERKGIEKKTFENEDHSLVYFEGGVGDTVMLIHGFGADAQMTWNKTIQDLAKDHHVIAPDLLWFGKSSSKKSPLLFTQVDAMLDLLEHRKITNTSLVGISYGGFISLGMVYAQKERFEKLVIVDSPGMTYNLDLVDSLCKQQNVEKLQDIFVLKDYQDLRELLEASFYKPRKLSKGILKKTHELYFSQNHEEQYILLDSLAEEKRRFESVEFNDFPPALVIWGKEDKIFPVSEGERLAKYLKADLKIVPKAGHAVNLDNFKVFQRYLRDFLDK